MKRDIFRFFLNGVSPNRGEGSLPAIVLGLVLVAGCLLSCTEAKPEGVLSKDEMTKVLTEFYLKEAKINALVINHDSAKKVFMNYRKKYANQTGMPDSILDYSYQYYLSRPKELHEIYNRVIDSLSLQHHKVGSPGGDK